MKAKVGIKKVAADLDVLRFPAPAPAPAEVSCLNCSWPLSLSQPDLDSPERLLGICERCQHWYLIDLIVDCGEGIMARLPGVQIIRDLSQANPGEGISIMGRDAEGKSSAAAEPAAERDAVP